MGTNLPAITPDMVEALQNKTGLRAITVADLLSQGWRYVENVGEISRWEHPMWQLEERRDSSMYDVLSEPVVEDPNRPGYDFQESPYPKQYAPRPSGTVID